MLGYVSTPDPNRYTAEKWEGKRVNRNGTEENGTVRRAYWQGPGEPVAVTVVYDDAPGVEILTDSEHVTLVRQ